MGWGWPEFGVGDDDEFSHDGGDCDEGFFAVFDEAIVEGSEAGIVFSGGERSHEEDALDLGASAAGAAIGRRVRSGRGGGRGLRGLRLFALRASRARA